MATLGEAFIAVRADMSPFRRELKAEVKAAAQEVEKGLSSAVEGGLKKSAGKAGKEAGEKAGDGIADGINRKLGDKNKSPWLAFAGALGGALDDGISALPTEVKAALVAGILAALPLVGAALTGAISAAVAAGVVVLGVALASQFDSVQQRWTLFATNTRMSLVGAAEAFAEKTVGALDTIEQQIFDWEPLFGRIFSKASTFVLPLLSGILDGVEFILDSIDRGLDNGSTFIQALADSFAILGDAIGQTIEILMSTGDMGADAFRDFVYLTGVLIVGAAELLRIFTGLYTVLRGTVNVIPDWLLALQPVLLLFKGIVSGSEEAKDATNSYAYTNVQFVEGLGTVVSMTKDEEKALKELEKAIKDARDAAFDSLNTNIAWEESIDDLDEAFERNGKTIDIETHRGRENLRALGVAIRAAQAEAEDRYARGEVNAAQARDLYAAETAEIYKVAAAHGITKEKLDAVYGKLLNMINLPAPDVQWAEGLAAALERAANASNRIKYTGAYGDFDPYGRPLADGGIVYGPTQALIGEAGTEAVIPVTKPARAAQLMRQSGLDRMVAGGGDTTVYVYLGNEAFDQHVQKIVVQDSRSQARQLSYGVRG